MDLIVSDPEILGGKPCVRGTRISVEFILELLASGADRVEILERLPQVGESGLEAAQAYDRLAEQAEFRTAVGHGLHDAAHGRVVGHDALVAETEARYGEPAE